MYTMEDLDILPPLLIIIMAAAYRQYRQHLRSRRKRRRMCWTRPWILRRQEHGAHNSLIKELSQEDHESYKNFVRMTKEDFTELLVKMSPLIVKKETIMRKSISPAERLSLTLRYLATGKERQFAIKYLSFILIHVKRYTWYTY